MAWTDGDFKLFAAGLAIGGKWNLGEVATSGIATCRYDAGQYDHFYIKFTKVISEFSFGQFQETVAILGKFGVISPTDAKKFGSTEIIVYADISEEDDGILVAGRENGYLMYESGKLIPKFAASMFITELMNIVKLAYIWDKVPMRLLATVTESIGILHSSQQNINPSDSVQIAVYTMDVGDNVDLSYFKT